MRDRPTLQDVAERAGVSRALVSIVMRDVPGASAATRERVRRAADEIGYRPDPRARMLRSQRSRLLGVVFTAGQEFHAGLIDGVYRAAESRGYDVLLSCVTPHHGEQQAVRTLLDDRCEALVLIGSELPTRNSLTSTPGCRWSPSRARFGVSTRCAAMTRSEQPWPSRIWPNWATAPSPTSTVVVRPVRPNGEAESRRAAATARIATTIAGGGLAERDGAAAATALLDAETDLPTAVFAFNDRCALGLIDILIRADVRVPAEVSVVGFDDSPLAGLAHVNLTTVGQDTAGLAERAVARAVDRIDGPMVTPVDVVCEPRLVVRASTAAPRL